MCGGHPLRKNKKLNHESVSKDAEKEDSCRLVLHFYSLNKAFSKGGSVVSQPFW